MKIGIEIYCAGMLLLLLASPALAGTDSAGTSSLGGQEQTDVLTHGGGIQTDGGSLDLSGGDVTGAGSMDADGVTATTIHSGTLDVSGAISNPNSAVSISDSVNVTGQADALRFRMSNLTPTAAGDATSKKYVDDQIQAAKNRISSRPAGSSGTLYECTVQTMENQYFTTLEGAATLNGQAVQIGMNSRTCCSGFFGCYECGTPIYDYWDCREK